MVQRDEDRIKQEVLKGEVLAEFAFDSPESVTMDASDESVLLEEDPARDSLTLYWSILHLYLTSRNLLW